MSPEATPPPHPDCPALAALGVFGVGVLLALGALAAPWFGVPVRSAAGALTLEGSAWAVLFRLVVLVVAGVSVLAWFQPARRRFAAGLLGAALAMLAFFPTVLAWRSAPLFARAQWLQTQHENLTWLGGDLFTSQESILAGEATSLAMVDAPRGSNIVLIPKSVPALVQVGRLSDILAWLGYTNGFCLCGRAGWFAALGSLGALLTGLLRRGPTLDLALFRQAIKAGAAVTGAGLLALAVPLLLAASLVGRAHHAAVTGDFAAASHSLERAAAWMPLIREDTFFITQAGLLAVRAGHDTPVAELFRTVAAEEAGHYHQAELGYADLLARTPALPAPLRREARRGLLRAAISHFNASRNEAAVATLLTVLADDPLDLKALLTLHRARVRAHDWAAAAEVAGQYRSLYARLNTVGRKPASAAVDLPRALAIAAESP